MLRRAWACALLLAALAGARPLHGQTPVPAPDAAQEVAATLDRFHAAAARADGAAYFALFAPEAVFIGTDAGERWDLAQFRAFALPYFQKGKGWTYVPSHRHVQLSPQGDIAWFDEALKNADLGVCRGTGVLRRVDGHWLVCQYHLTIPVPNALAKEVVKLIRAPAPPVPATP
jgi:hypothetical protein